MDILDFIFSQYAEYPKYQVVLEIIAVFFGILSVVFSMLNNKLVFPTGIISTGIFVYLLLKWSLLGDMLVNVYYFVMSIYGWMIWSKKINETSFTPISQLDVKASRFLIGLCLLSMASVFFVYLLFDKLVVEENSWIPYVDIFTTAIFFGGMWLMAKRKIEHWYFWIIANTISIPLYFIKGYSFTSFQYVVFLVIAVFGYFNWRKLYQLQE